MALPLLGITPASHAAALPKSAVLGLGRDQPFDFDWRFCRGDNDAFAAPEFDDSGWREVDLPHDWSIEDLPYREGSGIVGPFDPNSEGGAATGFSVGGEGWYRKRFSGDGVPAKAHIEILFEGIYNESDVWLNGQHLGGHVHGYTPFAIDLTPNLRCGDNVVAVRVRNLGRNSRWYSGSGIYRGVTVDVHPEAARVGRWGVAIATRRITETLAELEIETRLVRPTPDLRLVSRIRNAGGTVVTESASAATDLVKQAVTIAFARLWSPDTPTLYTLETELRRGDQAIDAVSTPFGVRIVTFDAEAGMRINGVPVKLRGGCVHHDNGLLGAAAFPDAEERRVRLLRARGFNALRSSHNPPSRAFLDACDRHGMLLIDEAFDTWFAPKQPRDYSTHFRLDWETALSTMVLSARNHPSVIMWSIGNEVPKRSSSEGLETAWRLANAVHRLDPTRPVTAAVNAFAGRPMIADQDTARPGFGGMADESAAMFLDVVGYNYKLDRYASDHARYPKRVMFGSESFPKEAFEVWSFAEAHPYMIGDFVWAAMDYLGEAGVGNVARNRSNSSLPVIPAWPWVISNCGDVDLIGEQKPQSYARDVVWRVSPIEMAVLRPLPDGMYEHPSMWGWSNECQSWTWPGAEGQGLKVRVYARAQRVELHLNGKLAAATSLSSGETLPVEFEIPYAPGRLEVIAFRGEQEIGRRSLETVGAAATVALLAEEHVASAERGRLAYIRVEVTDAKGRWVPDAKHRIRLTTSGPAKLLGFGSGSPLAQASFQSHEAETYGGRALAILKTGGTPGTVRLTAESEGLRPGSIAIRLDRSSEVPGNTRGA
ncbi:MAG TPA: glycoside hydrolase family 2 TIM barrel-domain containing protein [Alphaproteobacteria bacterium]|nr:glycoside hydrolase family 2 TIM barrel-domain containing protein [Alphaproteobacteria bacterium]